MIQGTEAVDRPVARRGVSRRLLALGIVGVALVAVAAAGGPSVRRWLAAERSVSLERLRIAEVTRGDLERDVAVQGRVVAASHPTAFSPAAGIVTFLVRAGELVAADRVLARVASPELDSRLDQERSTLLALESELDRERVASRQAQLAAKQRVDLAALELETARRAMDRAERSSQEGIINRVDYEKAQDDLRRAELALAHARENGTLEGETLEHALANRALQVERQRLVVADIVRRVAELEIRAPVAGLVARLDAEDRDAVVAGQPLVTVVDLSRFEVEVSVPEAWADEVLPGTPAVVTHDGREWTAEVRSIAPEVERSQVRAIVAFAGEAPAKLRQSQRLPTRILLDSRTNVLKVARGPFLEAGGGRSVYVVDDDTAVRRPIRTGATSVSEVEILDGLAEGERIIVSDTTRFENAERLWLTH